MQLKLRPFEQKEFWTSNAKIWAVMTHWGGKMAFKACSMVCQRPSFTCKFGKKRSQHRNALIIPLPHDANAANKSAAKMLSEGTVMKMSATHKTILADMQDHFDTFLCIDE